MKLLIVESWRTYRDVLEERCRDHFEIVGVHATAKAGLDHARREPVDLLLLDLHELSGQLLHLSQQFLEARPALRIIGIAPDTDHFTIYRVFNSPLHGYLCKRHDGILTVMEALTTVADGKTYFSEAAQALRGEMQRDPAAFYKILSDREMELLPDFCAGYSNEALAQHYGLRPSTVLWHRRNIMRKLNIHSATALMQFGIAHGFICPNEHRQRFQKLREANVDLAE
ncbi:MAG: LuxR C-terminal-related transcriptional regulator [Opitutales bacterium]